MKFLLQRHIADKTSLNLRNRRLNTWDAAFTNLVKLGGTLKVLPYDIDATTNLIVSCNHTGKRIWLIILAWAWIDILYLFLASSKVKLSTVSDDEFVNFYVHFFSRTIAVVQSTIIATDLEGLMKFNNMLLMRCRQFHGK